MNLDQHFVALGDVPAFLASRGGKRVHRSAPYRWSTTGSRGVVLETWQIGGTRYTSVEALARFIERCSAKTQPQAPASGALDEAEAELSRRAR